MWWIGCIRCEKSCRDFVARTFALIAPVHTVLHRVSCSYETITDEPKTLWNLPKQEFRVQWGGLGVFLRKIPMWLRGTNFCINCTSSLYFASSLMELRNDPKCTQTLYNAPKHEFRVQNEADCVRSLRKIQTWLRGTNFFINCFNSHRFAPSFMQLRNHNKCTQTQWNLWKYEFRVQWGGLGAFIAKNPVVTLWHELSH